MTHSKHHGNDYLTNHRDNQGYTRPNNANDSGEP